MQNSRVETLRLNLWYTISKLLFKIPEYAKGQRSYLHSEDAPNRFISESRCKQFWCMLTAFASRDKSKNRLVVVCVWTFAFQGCFRLRKFSFLSLLNYFLIVLRAICNTMTVWLSFYITYRLMFLVKYYNVRRIINNLLSHYLITSWYTVSSFLEEISRAYSSKFTKCKFLHKLCTVDEREPSVLEFEIRINFRLILWVYQRRLYLIMLCLLHRVHHTKCNTNST